MMDTSEQRIKMCEKAEEIQGERRLEEGDCYAYLRPKEGKIWVMRSRQEWLDNPSPIACLIFPVRDYEGLSHPYIDDIEHCWLPRQDQLQEMVQEKLQADVSGLIQDFFQFCFGIRYRESSPAIRYFDSMEQLWLAFVMKEKYGKVWNGEDWLQE